MSEYNWCHNPSCHEIETQSRIRGTGDNKVLRTVKIKVYNPEQPHIYHFFCNQQCLFQFLNKFAREVANLNPTPKPKETPIKVKKWKEERYRYRYDSVNGQERVPFMSTRTTIKSVDNDNG